MYQLYEWLSLLCSQAPEYSVKTTKWLTGSVVTRWPESSLVFRVRCSVYIFILTISFKSKEIQHAHDSSLVRWCPYGCTVVLSGTHLPAYSLQCKLIIAIAYCECLFVFSCSWWKQNKEAFFFSLFFWGGKVHLKCSVCDTWPHPCRDCCTSCTCHERKHCVTHANAHLSACWKWRLGDVSLEVNWQNFVPEILQ